VEALAQSPPDPLGASGHDDNAIRNLHRAASNRSSIAASVQGVPASGTSLAIDLRSPVHDLSRATVFRSALMSPRATRFLSRRLALGTALVWAALAAAGPAVADCRDAPNPKVNWAGCSKASLLLGRSDLTEASMAKAMLTSTNLDGATLKDARMSETELSFVRFEGADLTGADLSRAVGWRTSFRGANLAGAKFDMAQMSRAIFEKAKLAGASFVKSEVNRSDFEEADLTGANMSRAELARVDLTKAKLEKVDFSYSNLSRARLDGALLDGANLTGTYLYRAQLGGADLKGTRGLTQAQVDLACGTAQTKLPGGLAPPKTWPCNTEDD
jgi:uncharacterized protein YjbI with pentapeptide repeats